jgi:hypothetical protein
VPLVVPLSLLVIFDGTKVLRQALY